MNTLEIKKVSFTDDMLCVELVDKRVIMTPLSWYDELLKADEKSKNNYKLIAGKKGIEWEDLDYHLSLEGMIKGIVPPKKQTFERINISIPSDKLKIIDQKAKELHLTRSAFLLEAATQYHHMA